MDTPINFRGGPEYVIHVDSYELKLLKEAIHHLIELNKINEQSGYMKGGFSTVEDLTDLMFKIESARESSGSGEFRTLQDWEDYLSATEEAEHQLASFMSEMYTLNPHLPREEATPDHLFAPGKKIREKLNELKAKGLSDEEIAAELNALFLSE